MAWLIIESDGRCQQKGSVQLRWSRNWTDAYVKWFAGHISCRIRNAFIERQILGAFISLRNQALNHIQKKSKIKFRILFLEMFNGKKARETLYSLGYFLNVHEEFGYVWVKEEVVRSEYYRDKGYG